MDQIQVDRHPAEFVETSFAVGTNGPGAPVRYPPFGHAALGDDARADLHLTQDASEHPLAFAVSTSCIEHRDAGLDGGDDRSLVGEPHAAEADP